MGSSFQAYPAKDSAASIRRTLCDPVIETELLDAGINAVSTDNMPTAVGFSAELNRDMVVSAGRRAELHYCAYEMQTSV